MPGSSSVAASSSSSGGPGGILAGTWLLNTLTCGGAEFPGFLDGGLLVATFAGPVMTLEVRSGNACTVTLNLDATFDTVTQQLSAVPQGNIACTAGCDIPTVCGAAAATLVPAYSGTVTTITDGLVITGDNAAAWPNTNCSTGNQPTPGVHTYDNINKPRVTYYVDQNAPGASNTACDGLAPTNEGNGHCPFLDLSHPRTAHWDNVRKTTVRVKAGTYVLNQYCNGVPCDCQGSLLGGEYTGLNISPPAGLDETHRVIFEADGVVTLTGVGCTNCCDLPGDNLFDNRPIRLVAAGGSMVTIKGFVLQGAAYHDLTMGAQGGVVENNTFFPAAVADGDLLKGGGTDDVVVRGNMFDGFTDQAIDIAGPNHRWLLENNTFQNGVNGALGMKCGTTDVEFRNNLVRNLVNGTEQQLGAVGVGSCTIDNVTVIQSYCGQALSGPCFSASRINVHDNRFENIQENTANGALMAATLFYACDGCTFANNVVVNSDVGLFLNGVDYGDPGNPADANLEHPAILPSRDVAFHGNDFFGIQRIYYGMESNAVTSYARTDSNRHCINPVDHPQCGGTDPGNGADTAYFQDVPATCTSGLGLGTLTELEAAIGDVGTFHLEAQCPFVP